MKVVRRSSDLPEQWDMRAESYFQTREFLAHCELHNPCGQRYYVLEHGHQILAGVVVYSLRLDLFTFRNIRSPIQVNVVGVPCSVAAGGVVGHKEAHADLLRTVAHEERGFVLVLNLKSAPDGPGLLPTRTLPTVVFKNRFRCWADYLAGLRAPYRRWVTRVELGGACLERRDLPCRQFSDDMHRQYLEVLARSKGRLETLSPAFFRNLPAGFTLTAYLLDGREVGWKICRKTDLPVGVSFDFFLGGVDYVVNRRIPVYFNLLLDVLKDGIEAGASIIDLGQTAEVPKQRLGGELEERQMLMTHSNAALRLLLRALKPLLAYRLRIPAAHVFGMPSSRLRMAKAS